MADNEEKRFELGRIYIKDVSYEVPMGAEIFAKKWAPEISLNMHSDIKSLAKNSYEVALTATVTGKLEGETAFLVEVKQAGQFQVIGLEGEELTKLLNIACPNLLFPYLRETIDNLVTKGGLPPLRLQPINFDALYEQARAQRQQQEQQH
jgi:preprotein translocase subunit SecB